MKVLVLENSQLYLAFLQRLFGDLGFATIIAGNVTEASERLARGGLDLICMNRYIPGGDALNFMREVRALLAGVPAIMLTSDRDPATRASALAAGVTEVIYKTTGAEMGDRIRAFVLQHLRRGPRRGRVLYVEDSRTESMIISRFLVSIGMEVEHFHTAEEALERLADGVDFDLVISDVLLRGEKSGLSLVAAIRAMDDKTARIPVLTITGFDDPARRIELLRAGTNDYIVKPVMEEELAVRVGNLIASKQLMDKVIAQQALLHELAVTDQLTGCSNRRGFREFTERYLASARRRGAAAAVLLLDLDHFKQVNDRYGHDVGDKVLKAVARRLRDTCREGDVVSRFGGEEFVVFLPDIEGARAARAAAERFRRAVAEVAVDGINVTVSIGVTLLASSREADMRSALQTADRAVYRAKQRGRNCVSYRSLKHVPEGA